MKAGRMTVKKSLEMKLFLTNCFFSGCNCYKEDYSYKESWDRSCTNGCQVKQKIEVSLLISLRLQLRVVVACMCFPLFCHYLSTHAFFLALFQLKSAKCHVGHHTACCRSYQFPSTPASWSIGDLTSRVTDLIISFVEHVVVLVKWAQL